MNFDQKEIFSIRKFNTGTHSARLGKVALASAVALAVGLGSTAVSANETTTVTPSEVTAAATDNPATNLEAAQPAASSENTEAGAQAGTNTGAMVTPVETPALDQAVAEANQAGVTVTESPSVTHDSLSAAEKDAASQVVAVEKATDEKKSNTVAIEKATETNAQIDRENAAEDKRVEELNKAGQEAVDQRNTINKNGVDSRNAAALEQWEQDKATIIAADEKAMEGYEERKAANEAANKAGQEAVDQRNSVKKAEYDNKKAEFDAKIAEMAANTSKTGYASEVTYQSLDFNSEPKATYTASGVTNTNDYGYILQTGEELILTYTGLENSTYNGTKISKVVFTYTGKGDGVNVAPQSDPTVTLNFRGLHEPNNSGVSRVGFKAEFYDENGDVISFTKEAPAVISLSSLNRNSTRDGVGTGEGVELTNDNARFVYINGSTIEQHGNKIYSTIIDNTNTIYGAKYHANEWDLLEGDLRYYGAGLLVQETGSAIEFDIVRERINGDIASRGDYYFGFNTKVAADVVPTPPKYDPEKFTPTPFNEEPPTPSKVPNKPELETFTPEKFTPTPFNETPPTPSELPKEPTLENFVPEEYVPVTPVHKPHVEVPKTVDVSVSVHPVLVKQSPAIDKDVVNVEGVSIDGQLVPKGSTIDWVLNPGVLEAGRETITKVVFNDPLPGMTIDREWTGQNTSDLVFVYGEDNKVEMTLSSQILAAINKDRSTDFVFNSYRIRGTVDSDGATYKNTYSMTITTESGKEYKVYSDRPVVYTPGSETRTYNGNVIVRYFEEATGDKIAPNQVDLEDAKVGTSYDTTDHKEQFISFEGKTYERTDKVVGLEEGKVTDGTIFVDYFYKVVELDGGNVIVHYEDEDGNKISNDVVDTPDSPVGTEYNTTDHKTPQIVTEDGVKYEIVVEKTRGNEEGEVVEGTTEVTYVYKRVTPKPETPTPNDNLIRPVKDVVLNETGQSVDGKTLLPNTKVSFTYKADYDQYKGMVVSEKDMLRGSAIIGNLTDDSVKLDFTNFKAVTESGKEVTELKLYTYNSISEVTNESHLAILKNSKITFEEGDDFYIWAPDDFVAYANKYMLTGNSVYITVAVETGDFIGTFNNKIWQVDFGNGYEGNIVENNIPKLQALKDVVKSIGSNESIANGNIALGQTFPYVINGPAISANIAGGLKSYVEIDNFDEKYDEYNGEFYRFAEQDIKLKDGTVIKAGEEITRFYTQTIERDETGRAISVTFTVDPAFLEMIAEDSLFDPIGYMIAKRIAYGENIENTLNVAINGYEVEVARVVTHTPKPEAPRPSTPTTPNTPEAPKPALPQTGEVGSILTVVGGAVLSGLGLAGVRKRKED